MELWFHDQNFYDHLENDNSKISLESGELWNNLDF